MAKTKIVYRNRRKKKSRKKSKPKLPLLPTLGFAQNFARRTPRGTTLIEDIQKGDVNGFLYDGREIFLGVDANGKFHLDWALNAWLPVGVGYGASKVADKTGINRGLAKVPVVGKYIKL